MKAVSYTAILLAALTLGACAMPKDDHGNTLTRLNDCKMAIDANRDVKPGYVVHDHGTGPFGNGMFCYGPKTASSK